MKGGQASFSGEPEKDAVTEDEARRAVARVLASPDFAASDRRRAFLRFVVDETLAGRGGRLKGHAVAVAVFGRDVTFDPQADPVVRIEARRLRRDLDGYYAETGAADAVRISIPKGSYAPHFERRAPPPGPAAAPSSEAAAPAVAALSSGAPPRPSRGRRRALLAAATAILAILAAVGWNRLADVSPPGPGAPAFGPVVAVAPFAALGDGDDGRHLAAGLTEELLTDLMRFSGFRLYALPEGGAGATPKLEADDVAYLVGGSVRAEADGVRVTANVSEVSTGRVLWSETFDRPATPGALIAAQGELAAEIASALGQPYGLISDDLRSREAAGTVSEMSSYICVLRAYDYRRDFAAEAFPPVLACLEAAVARDPGYADAWAMLGWLRLDAGRYGFAGAGKPAAEYDRALVAARRALQIEPDSVLALKALSSIQHYRGAYEDSERLARRAVDLNPHDPDTLAQLGWRLAVRGRFEEGVPFLRRAIERSVDPPGWYFHLLAIDHLMKGDDAAMLREAERAALTSRPISEALLAIAAGGVGDGRTAGDALSRIPAGWDAEAYFRRHGATDDIVAALMEGLETARQVAGIERQP